MTHVLFLRNDLHRTASQYKAGAHEDRVADLFRHLHAVLDVGDGDTLRLGDIQFEKKLFESISVLRLLNGSAVGSDDAYSVLLQRLCKIDGSLASENGYHTLRLLHLHDVHDILYAQGFKIQLVGGGIIRGHGLGIIIDNDGLIAGLSDGLHGMYRRIVELDALTDSDRAGAQNDDLLFIEDDRLVLLLVGGIKVRNIAFKFGRAGIDHLIHGYDFLLLSQVEDLSCGTIPQKGDLPVTKAHPLRLIQSRQIPRVVLQYALHAHNVPAFLQEEQIDSGDSCNLLHRNSSAQELGDRIDSVIGADTDIRLHLVRRHLVKLRMVQMEHADLQRTDRF